MTMLVNFNETALMQNPNRTPQNAWTTKINHLNVWQRRWGLGGLLVSSRNV